MALNLYLRYRLLATSVVKTLNYRSIHFSYFMAEKEFAELKHNPFYDKYAMKINKLKVENPDQFITRLETNFARKNEKTSTSKCSVSAPKQPKPDITNATSSFTKQKKLDDVMKVELLEDKTAKEISQIWTEYYRSKSNSICAIMPSHNYQKIRERAVKFDTFVFSLPRDEGYEFILTQFASNEFHFTSVINYQAYRENAPECLTIVYYSDLEVDKGITLMCGQYDPNVLNGVDAQFLANQIQLYYAGDGNHLELLKKFKYSPDTWSHNDIIHQLETTNFITT